MFAVVVTAVVAGAEGGDFDHFAAEAYMQQFKAAANQACTAEQLFGLLRMCRGGDA